MRSRDPHVALADTEIRLLRVFQAVVRQQGLAAAQTELGLSPATISNHLANLETRLGVRLCNRGRRGFSLTPEGERIHEASLSLFRSVENFSSVVGSVRGELTGTLHFAAVDALHTNAELALGRALERFARAAPGVTLHVDVASPHDLRQRLLDGRYQLIMTPLPDAHPSLTSIHLFDEEQTLYCGSTHPLFGLSERKLAARLRQPQRYATRSYATERGGEISAGFTIGAVASHMESLALLVLSGAFIGHLPTHYAGGWQASGAMRALLPRSTSYIDSFYLTHARGEQNRAADLLHKCILQCCRATGTVNRPGSGGAARPPARA
jgi:DNA-binding transcriptional LysR family regulator